MNLTPEIHDWLRDALFNEAPVAMALVAPDWRVIAANPAFEAMFGRWQNVSGDRLGLCEPGDQLSDGPAPVRQTSAQDPMGGPITFVQQTRVVHTVGGEITHALVICQETLSSKSNRLEHQLLFDLVPCNILLIDRNYRIVRTNARVRDMLGQLEGGYCFQGLKGFDHRCLECTARQTFEDGKTHTGHHVWRTLDGRVHHLHVITVPVLKEDGQFDVVMEMAVDITQAVELQDGLNFSHTFLETIVATAMDAIFAVDQNQNVTIFNPAARRLFEVAKSHEVRLEELERLLPDDFLSRVRGHVRHIYLPDARIRTLGGDTKPVRLVGRQLVMGGEALGMAFVAQDLTEIKTLESEKLEAERLAAVGQTVAGLAHGVKNLLNALEGGLYMLSTGMAKADLERISKGMTMLTRNVERVGMFVKAFLGFSKGREIQAAMNKPAAIAREVVDAYAEKAKSKGIDLVVESHPDMALAAIDYEGMHECLTNLVGNAIDACLLSDRDSGHRVVVRTFEQDGMIVYEVSDNGCGMDYNVKQKVFTSFFTTKGLGGTGIGLLTSRKIVQEHGGYMDLESTPNQGSTFRICLPRSRLPRVVGDASSVEPERLDPGQGSR